MHRFENGMEEADTQAPLDVNEVSKNLRARALTTHIHLEKVCPGDITRAL